MPNFLTTLLAQLWDKFKLNNPTLATFILAAIVGLQVLLTDPEFLAAVPESIDWLPGVARWVTLIYGLLTGSSTFNYLPAEKQRAKIANSVKKF